MQANIIEPTRSTEFWAGAKATIPLVVGAIPFGIIFGALAVKSGFSPAGAAGMSAFVFAGSSQFIATSLAAGGATSAFVILTTFVVNLRHALYSATLGPYVKHLPQRWLLPLGFWLTDEAFVVAIQRYRQEDKSQHKHWFFLGSAMLMYVNWQLCTWIGIFTGQAIPASWGLEFAMVVTFIGMLVPLIIGRPTLVAVLVAGVTAVLVNDMPNRLGLLVAAMLGIIAGVIAERFIGEAKDE